MALTPSDINFLKILEDKSRKTVYPIPQLYSQKDLGKLYELANKSGQWDQRAGYRQGSFVRSLIDDAREKGN
jgi:hypothetical protein